MGTVVSFHVWPGDCPPAEAERAIARACADLHAMEELFSTWVLDSPMSMVRVGRLSPDEAPPEIARVLELCALAKEISSAWFDPWALPGGVDPTGLVKGWAVERAAGILQAAGIKAAIVNGGGDIKVFGPAPEVGPAKGDSPLKASETSSWRVGVQHPWRPEAFACVLEIASAVATSGTYERGLHLVDPRDGTRAKRSASATVIGPSLALADALATAVAVGGNEALEVVGGIEGYEAYWISADGAEVATHGMVFA